MKKFTILFLFMFAITLAGAFATFQASDVTLGSSSQTRGVNVTKTLTVTNNGPGNISDFNITFSSVNSKYQTSATGAGVAIVNGSSVSVTIKGYVALDLDAVDSRGKEKINSLGTIVIAGRYANGSAVPTKEVALYMQAENLLRFGDPRITIADRSDKSLDDGDSFDKVSKGDNIVIDLEVENRFDNNGNCDEPDDYGDCEIQDIEGELEPNDSDFDDDSASFGDLKADKAATEVLSFAVPSDIDEDDYDFELWVTGEDENGALHGEFMEFTLEVTVPDDEITVVTASLSPSSLLCGETLTTLKAVIENTGLDDQDKASIFVISSKLGIRQEVYNIVIDEGERVTKTFDLTLPSNLKTGEYVIAIEANYNKNVQTDLDSVVLTVTDCTATTTPTTPATPTDDSNTQVNVVDTQPSTGVIYGQEKDSFFDSPIYLMLLGGLLLVAILMFAILVIAILRK